METNESLEPHEVPLSAAEEADWAFLVETGTKAYEEHHRGNREAHAEAAVAKYGAKGEWRPEWRRKKRRASPSAVDEDAPPSLKRWVLARQAGLSPKEASASSGATWGKVAAWRQRSRAFKRAVEAMHASSHELMVEMAHGTVEACLSAPGSVGPVEAKAAQWALERLERETFAERRPQDAAGPAIAAGGLTIHLVDVSKPYVPPALAAEGDPAEGVEV